MTDPIETAILLLLLFILGLFLGYLLASNNNKTQINYITDPLQRLEIRCEQHH